MTAGGWPDGTPGLVTLPDGRQVRGRGLRAGSRQGTVLPELGVYLTARRPRPDPWESIWIAWPDFGLPLRRERALADLQLAHDRAQHQRLEIGCRGGIGRTGTAIALLARLAGVPADDAVAWTRAHYHPRAVETPWQALLVARGVLA